MQTSRRSAIKTLAASALTTSSISSFAAMEPTGTPLALKGRIKQSVCYWCYRHIPFEDFCKDVKAIGLTAVDLTGPAQWPILKKHGLTCSLAEGAGKGIEHGFNDPK